MLFKITQNYVEPFHGLEQKSSMRLKQIDKMSHKVSDWGN